MRFEDVAEIVQGTPHITAARARELFDFVRAEKPQAILELGFAHGASTCYMAAALAENGAGTVTTMDLESARKRTPNLDDLMRACRLERFVRPVYATTSYTWELAPLLERGQRDGACFDFAFIDGAHSWDTDGFAFFLVDRLLKPGSWILFDDLDWTYGASPTLGHTEAVARMPATERRTAQVGLVFDLLVRGHPGYGEFRVDREWGWARKVRP